MTASDLLGRLRARGLSFELRGEKLIVGPSRLITPADADAIRAARPGIVAALSGQVPPGGLAPSDDAVAAIADRAFLDPPDFESSPFCLRESIILRLEGIGCAAFSREEIARLDAQAELKRRRAEAAAKAKADRPAGRAEQGGLFG